MNASPAATELSQEKPQGNCCLVDELINNAVWNQKNMGNNAVALQG